MHFTERTFFASTFDGNLALQYDFTIRRHLHIIRLAFDNFQR